jgi:thiol:disulfide interchange protein
MNAYRIARRLALSCAGVLLLALATPRAAAAQLYDPRANASAAVDSAVAQARADHKLVLLDFGADWCLDCLILERLFQQPGVKPYLEEHFHVVRIDVGQFDRNLKLVAKYGNPIDGGIPAAVVLAPDGRRIATTRDGSLESARRMTPSSVLAMLQGWVAASQ